MSALEHNPLFDACDCEDCRFWRVAEPMLERYRDTAERRRYLFTFKCLMIADSLETCEALMRGEKVPKSRLRPEQAKAYGY